nr:hypothetical protein [Flavobacterium psychrophilum]
MKAIHNRNPFGLLIPPVGNYKLKYNFESNSQLELYDAGIVERW